MKYGQCFQEQSLPKWAPYNVDYNDLKNLIKVHTTKNQSSAIAIPGQTNTALSGFEELFYNELFNQHDRVDLFVKDKAGEIDRRLRTLPVRKLSMHTNTFSGYLQKNVLKLLAQLPYSNGKPMTQKKQERFQKYDTQIERCGIDIRHLQRFVDAQRVAFYKILKKYKKWTGSQSLSDRFNQQVLGSPKSFTRRDFKPLLSQYRSLISDLRENTPEISLPPTPERSRRSSAQTSVQPARQSYWNEYDNGSEAGDEPYTIYLDPNVESTFPGAKIVTRIISSVGIPIVKVKAWLGPQSVPEEQRSLLAGGSGVSSPLANGYITATSESDFEEAGYASSSDIPGYTNHYATFPSVHDQRFARYRESLLFRGMIAAFAAALVLLLIADILVTTGRHRLRVEVDAGAITGVVSSLGFATVGFGMLLVRVTRVGWLQRISVFLTFVMICVLNVILLALIVANSSL